MAGKAAKRKKKFAQMSQICFFFENRLVMPESGFPLSKGRDTCVLNYIAILRFDKSKAAFT